MSFVHPALFLFEKQLAGCMITRGHNLTDKSKPALSRMEDVGTGCAYEKPDFVTQLCFNPALNDIPIVRDGVLPSLLAMVSSNPFNLSKRSPRNSRTEFSPPSGLPRNRRGLMVSFLARSLTARDDKTSERSMWKRLEVFEEFQPGTQDGNRQDIGLTRWSAYKSMLRFPSSWIILAAVSVSTRERVLDLE